MMSVTKYGLAIIVGFLIFILTIFIKEKGEESAKIGANKSQKVIEKWNSLYPEAIGKNYHTFCDKNGFLKEVYLYDNYIIGYENLVRADNDVPIRCNPTSFNVQERTGSNTPALF